MRKFPCTIQMVLMFSVVLFSFVGCGSEDDQKDVVTDQKNSQPTSPLADETGAGKDGDIITNSIGMKMVHIPAGKFMMGSPVGEAGRDADEALHEVAITKGFYLGQYEVMQGQYARVMGSNPSHFEWDNNPVESVSWDDAMAFCRNLSEKPEEKAAGRRYTLPTEAQWEYACRAGSATAYYYGDNSGLLGDYAWYDGNSGRKTQSTGGKKPNGWGLYDMHGNAWEWCLDWYDRNYYTSSPPRDPAGPPNGTHRVLRGGGWSVGPLGCRAANRLNYAPDIVNYYFGFRVVCVGVAGLD